MDLRENKAGSKTNWLEHFFCKLFCKWSKHGLKQKKKGKVLNYFTSLMKYLLYRWWGWDTRATQKREGTSSPTPKSLLAVRKVMLFCEKMQVIEAYSLRWKKKQQEQNEAQQKPDSGIKWSIIMPLYMGNWTPSFEHKQWFMMKLCSKTLG